MPEGLHCEGAALHSLLGLLLWDQIYQVQGQHFTLLTYFKLYT